MLADSRALGPTYCIMKAVIDCFKPYCILGIWVRAAEHYELQISCTRLRTAPPRSKILDTARTAITEVLANSIAGNTSFHMKECVNLLPTYLLRLPTLHIGSLSANEKTKDRKSNI